MLSGMLEKDPSQRLTLDELNKNAFLTDNGALPGPLDDANYKISDEFSANNKESNENSSNSIDKYPPKVKNKHLSAPPAPIK
jgi:hypothetical protein